MLFPTKNQYSADLMIIIILFNRDQHKFVYSLIRKLIWKTK